LKAMVPTMFAKYGKVQSPAVRMLTMYSDEPQTRSYQPKGRRFVAVVLAAFTSAVLVLAALAATLLTFVLLAGFLLWIAVGRSSFGWRAEADVPGGVLRRWDRILGIFLYARELPVGEVACIRVFPKDEGWLDWLKDLVFSVVSPDRGETKEGETAYWVSAECLDGTSFFLMEFAEVQRALNTAMDLSTILAKPMRDMAIGDSRVIFPEDAGVPYADRVLAAGGCQAPPRRCRIG